MLVCACWFTCSKRQTWKQVRERWRWKKTAVRHLLCNSARGCSVRHNSPPSTQCYSNCRNASAARYWIWNDSKRTECCIVTEANHRIASKNIWMGKKMYKKWETLMQLLIEVHLLCFLCGHAAVILWLNTDVRVSCFCAFLLILSLHACVLSCKEDIHTSHCGQNDLWVLIRE